MMVTAALKEKRMKEKEGESLPGWLPLTILHTLLYHKQWPYWPPAFPPSRAAFLHSSSSLCLALLCQVCAPLSAYACIPLGLRLGTYWYWPIIYWSLAEQVVMLSWHYIYNRELACLFSGTQVAQVSSAFRVEGLVLLRCGDWSCLLPSGPMIVWSFRLTLLVTDFVSSCYCPFHPVCQPCGLLSRMLPCSTHITGQAKAKRSQGFRKFNKPQAYQYV